MPSEQLTPNAEAMELSQRITDQLLPVCRDYCEGTGRLSLEFRVKAIIAAELARAPVAATLYVNDRYRAMLRSVWESGVSTARLYGDNICHLQGEQADKAFARAMSEQVAPSGAKGAGRE